MSTGALDVHNLKPKLLAMLLNATPLGEVISLPTVYRQQAQAGLRFGNGKSIDLLKYTAWLYHERRRLLAEIPDQLSAYEALKESARRRNAEMSAAGRDIGELPAVVNAERREQCRTSFKLFCETYFKPTFCLNWSDDHLKVIHKIELSVLRGGLFAMAMPRGSGKTSLCEVACIWSILYGAQEFVCLLGSDEGRAESMLHDIKMELEHNDLLLADFPEVCYPIHCLDGIANRCAGQTYQGQRTLIGWTAKEINLPTIPGSAASGAAIMVAGITGGFRGMKVKRSDGRSIRPSLVLLDDPQTDDSSRSPSQCAEREAILAGAILGLAGPGKKIAGLMTLTVIRPDDMADRILDRQKHPQWQGERTKMVYAFPSNQKLWNEYAQIRADGMRAERGVAEANDFYSQHKDEMDQGAVVAWAERYNTDELSALQHAMNKRLDNEAAFYAEYQNEPLVPDQQADDLLTADQICGKTNGFKRGLVPQAAQHLSAFIDVQQDALFYVVCAWEDNFSGYVIDYGCYPDQRLGYFTLKEVTKKLSQAAPGTGLEGWIFAGLEKLTGMLIGKEWMREDGSAMRIGKCLIDANWGTSTDVVKQFCRQSKHAAIVVPAHGRFVGAATTPFDEYKRKPGDRIGHHWRMPASGGTHRVRHVAFDTNYWKSFVHARLCVAKADRGCLSLFESKDHRMFADHLTSEIRLDVTARGRTVGQWNIRSPGRDNHWLDCIVGCAVGASMLGVKLSEAEAPPIVRKRIKLSEIQNRKVWRGKREWIDGKPYDLR